MFRFYVHYEEDESYFVFPNKVVESADVVGETNDSESFSLP